MAFADSNRASLRILAEDPNAWGVIPASGSPREMRIVSSSLAYNKETQTSDELRSDRMTSNIIEVGASSEGEIDGEFSAGAMDEILAAFLYGAWSRPMTLDEFTGVGVSITANNSIAIAGFGNITHYFTVGRRVKVEGFKTLANNNYFTISAVNHVGSTTTITTSETSMVVEGGTVNTKVLDANDVLVRSSAIRFGTSGFAGIDSNGGNLFAAAIAAGQIKVGQKLHIDGTGFDVGEVAINAAPAAGDKITINDGTNQVTFQFGGSVLPGFVNVTAGADGDTTGTALANAINQARIEGRLNVVAVAATVNTDESEVTITNFEKDGGSITESEAGSVFAVTNFAGADDSLRGVFTVTSTAADQIGLSPAPGTDANGTKVITIKGSMLRNPSVVTDFIRQSFTIETSYQDVNQHFVARGLRVGTFEMNVASGEIVTFNTSFMGTGMERRPDQTSLLSNAPYTPKRALTHEVLNATVNVGNLTKNGQELATALQSISLSGDASLRAQNAVGSKFPRGIGVGRFQLTGAFTAYFESGEMFDDFVAHDTISLGFNFTDINQYRYEITLPAIKLTSDPVSPGGIDEDVVEEIEWEAQRDPATECMIQFDRFSSMKTPTAAA